MTTLVAAPRRSAALALARVFWLVVAAGLVAIFVGGIGPRYRELTTLCPAEPCIPLTLLAVDARALAERGISIEAYGRYHIILESLGAVTTGLLALFIFWKRADDWLGWLVSFALLLFGLNFMVEADLALVRQFPAWQRPFELLSALAGVPFALLFYVFPDGRFVPRWTRPVAVVLSAAALVDPLTLAAGLTTASGQISQVFLVALLASLVVGVYAQGYRYRRVSSPAERQQTKWVVGGLLALFIVILHWSYFVEIAPPAPGSPRLMFNLVIYSFDFLLFLLFPVSVFVSILRYRLWDIDVIIRRTLTYSLLSALLVAVYFGSVVVLQGLVRAVGGGQTALVTVISTLAIAALFNPLRARVQVFIDRRFYRYKVDAARTLARFSRTARDEVEIEALTLELLDVVRETMQPTAMNVWLPAEVKLGK